MRIFCARKICFSVVKVNKNCDKMLKVMQGHYNTPAMSLKVQDLSDAIKYKSHEEVTKEFVNAASFILSAAVSSKGQKQEPLWDTKQFAEGQWFSQQTYFTVKEIEPKGITVKNSFGERFIVSKDILEKMDSASHFEKEVPMTMTELAELLE